MDGYSIVENSSNYFFNNESQVDFNPSGDFSPIKASEIYSKYGGDSPLVLITHFSNREAYSNGKSYSVNDNFYSDTSNVGDIGEIFSSELNRLGINTIHLNETYASGSIYNSRSEYEKSLKAALTQFPSITYVINISRDISINKDMSMIKSVISHNEKSLAQLSFISGTNLDSMTDNQIKNADFAASLSAFANESINRFIKQNTVSQFSLSQDYSTFCLEIEFGSYANSFDEAVNSAYCFADLLSEYLTN